MRDATAVAYAEEKVPGGKLVRVAIARDGRVEVSGDFFVHPEEGLSVIEDALGRLAGDMPELDIDGKLQRVVARAGIELIGVDVPTIVRLYRECLSCGE